LAFNGFEYIASYSDLMAAFGPNKAAGEFHYANFGRFEGRAVTFDALEYIASYADLRAAFGANEDAGASHFIVSGRFENRVSTFDGLQYVASHSDLIRAFGANGDAGSAHYITNGASEGRDSDSFSAYHYLHNYADLQAAFGNNVEAATQHYITNGFAEGRVDTADLLWAGGLRIMAVGDSLTRGTGSIASGGYRGPLDNLFNGAGENVDFVGDFTAGTIADRQHQGVSGLTSTELLAGRSAGGVNVDLVGAMQRNAPDVVLLMIGTNDVLRETNAASTVPGEIVSIVNKIHSVNPEAHVLVGNLTPLSPATEFGAGVVGVRAATNAGISQAVLGLEAQGHAVSLVDTSSLTQADLIDGVHLTPGGYQKLASIWFDAVQDEVPHPGAIAAQSDFIV
jgi:lysophospholipase L1-like esterase